MNTPKRMLIAALALAAGGATLFWSGDMPAPSGSFIGQAEARIGRPLTPLSYAGVARRTTRRAVRAGAYYGGGRAYYGGAYYAAPRCRW